MRRGGVLNIGVMREYVFEGNDLTIVRAFAVAACRPVLCGESIQAGLVRFVIDHKGWHFRQVNALQALQQACQALVLLQNDNKTNSLLVFRD